MMALVLTTLAAAASEKCSCLGGTGYGSECARWDAVDEVPWCRVGAQHACGADDTFESNGHFWSHSVCHGKGRPFDPKVSDTAAGGAGASLRGAGKPDAARAACRSQPPWLKPGARKARGDYSTALQTSDGSSGSANHLCPAGTWVYHMGSHCCKKPTDVRGQPVTYTSSSCGSGAAEDYIVCPAGIANGACAPDAKSLCASGMRTTTVPSFCAMDMFAEMEQAQTALARRVLLPYLETMEAVGGPTYSTMDIGCAFGWYSMFFATMGFPVLCFDPGNTGPATTASKTNGLTQRIRIVNKGVSSISDHGSGVAYHDGFDSSNDKAGMTGQLQIAPSLVPYVECEVALVKIDVEGREIGVLRAIQDLVKSGMRVNNIIIEFTPKWWPEGFEKGMVVIEAFEREGWTFAMSSWSEHAARVGKPPFGIAPDGVEFDWDTEPLLMVQTVPKGKMRTLLASTNAQRDYWMEAPDAAHPLDRKAHGVLPLQCEGGDMFRYAERPRYLKNPAATTQCLDVYHKGGAAQVV